MKPLPGIGAALAMVALGAPAAAAPQVPTPLDSLQIVEEARSAQVRFERTRRSFMPWSYPTYGPCDVRIGRYCLSRVDWSEDGPWTPPEEDPKVAVARSRLIAHLDTAASQIPGHAWVAGQRVRYLVEAGDYRAALVATEECRAPQGWCPALAGLVHYAARDFLASERAYAVALSQMDETTRCAWTDLSDLLMGDLRTRYGETTCENRDPLQRRILWLADPFYSIPGNELAAEHFSRRVHSALLRDAESPEGDRWGQDIHQIVMRYGWSFGWERIRRSSQWTLNPEIRGRFAHGAKYFLPHSAAVDDPGGAPASSWKLAPRRPRSGHVPRYAETAFRPLSHHVTVFPRGDSAIVVATFEITDDSVPSGALLNGALVLQQSERSHMTRVHGTFQSRAGVLTATVPFEPHLMSLEVLAVREERAARARYGLDPSDIVARSGHRALAGLLLTRAGGALPETLDAAIAAARPQTRVRPGERLGLYWEVHGLGRAEPIATSLTLARRGKGVVRRVIGWLGLGSGDPPISLQWRDVGPTDDAPFARGVAADLPANLSDGEYVFTLLVEFGDGATVQLNKTIRVRGDL